MQQQNLNTLDPYAAERAKAQARFNEDCKSAKVVRTASGNALLIGDTVIGVSSSDFAAVHFLCAALNALAEP